MTILKKWIYVSWKQTAFLLLLLFAALFPLYRHILDMDAVGYITVARHYAAGEWHNAINGYWSPLNSWLLVPLVKFGFNDILCFKIANVFFGIGALYQTQKLLDRFHFLPWQKAGILYTAMVMVLYWASVQIAADMLFVWIFLWYVNVALCGNLDTSIQSNMRLGLVAAIAFFAKTYAGVFFILHYSFIHIIWFPWVQKKGWHLQKYLVGMMAWLPLIIMWMALLWNKYHIISFGYSGPLNWSWVLKGGDPDYQPFFYLPPYQGAVSRWVDPYYSQTHIYSPFQSKALLWKGLRLIGYNVKNGWWAALWISFASPILLVWLVVKRKLNTRLYFIACIIVLFPLVYLLVFMEERYLWPVSVLLLVAGAYVIKHRYSTKKWMWWLLFFSFIIGPLVRLASAANRDVAVTQLVTIIKQQQLHGRFTAMDSGEWMHKAAFITGNQYLPFTKEPKNWEAVEAECAAADVAAICIEKFSSDEAIAFLASNFYKKHAAHTVQVPGRYLWVVALQ